MITSTYECIIIIFIHAIKSAMNNTMRVITRFYEKYEIVLERNILLIILGHIWNKMKLK